MYDIAIVGLGPAGATLARLLDRRYSVFAVDRKRISLTGGQIPRENFTKPCGGLLSADAQKALSKFNLTLPKEILVDPQIFAVKTIDLKQKLIRHYQRFYINLDRDRFDRWLIGKIPDGTDIADGARCVDIKKIPSGFLLTYSQDGIIKRAEARIIVGADGSGSAVRRKLFGNVIRGDIPQYLAIQQYFDDRHATPFYSCIFDSDLTDSYCWSISKDGQFVLGGAFPVKDGKARFGKLKLKLVEFGYSFGEPTRTEACLVSRPQQPGDFRVAKDGAFLAGEAAGFISPSSLEGISYALDSANILAEVLNGRAADKESEYRLKTAPMRAKLLMKLVKSQFMYRPLLRRAVMASGLQSIEISGSEK